jgi:hypothetical protein
MRGNGVFICSLKGHLESLTKDIQHQITPDETHQVISAGGGLRERASGRLSRLGKAHGLATLIKGSLRRPPSQLAVPVSSIVFLLEYQRLLAQVFFSLHCHSAKKTTSVVIVKLLHDAVPPRLAHWNKPRFNSVEQTEPDQIAHPSRIVTAAKENQLVIHLLVLWYAQTPPARPDSINCVLTSLVENRVDRTSSSCQIDTVQAVKPNWAIQVTRPHIVSLMNLVHLISHQRRVLPSLGFVRSRSSVRQLLSTQNPTYGSQRRHRFEAKLFEFPLNRLSSAKQSLVVETEANQLHGLYYFPSQLTRAAVRTRRSALVPVRSTVRVLVPSDPLVNPFSRVTQRSSDARDLFTARITFNRNLPIALLFSLHRRLQFSKGINVEQKPDSRKLDDVFQRTVTNVLALNRVTKVLALINY